MQDETWFVTYFKTHVRYEVDHIFLDGVEYKVIIQKNISYRYLVIQLRPLFDYGHNDQYVCKQTYLVEPDRDTFTELFSAFGRFLQATQFTLYYEDICQSHVEIRPYDKNEYKAKVYFLTALGQGGTCGVCQEPALNTERVRGCYHPIHLRCLYSLSKCQPTYICTVCKRSSDWIHLLGV